MAPSWRLALVLSLMLVGVLAKFDPEKAIKKTGDFSQNVVKNAANGILGPFAGLSTNKAFLDLYKMVSVFGPQDVPCRADVKNFTELCAATVIKDFSGFKDMMEKVTAIGAAKTALRTKRMTGNTKAGKDMLKKYCKSTFAFALCMSRHLCQWQSGCKPAWISSLNDMGKAFLKPYFTNKNLCKGYGNVDDLGCKDVNDFRSLDKKCTDKVKDKVQTCQKDAKDKAKNKAKGDESKVCLETYYTESCIAQAKCDKCDSIVADVAQTVAQAKIDARYLTNCSSIKPRSAKCINIGVIVGASVGGVLGLCLLIGICCCCCKSAGSGGAKSSASSSPAKGKSKAKMQGQSKMAAKSKA